MIWNPKNDFTVLTFPGVPSELKQMWERTGMPWLRNKQPYPTVFLSRVLKVTGVKESTLAEELNELLENKNPTLAPYAELGEVKLRLTAKSKNIQKAQALIRPFEDKVRKKIGIHCYGADKDSLASVVLELLRMRKETLGVAESCTG